jgi:hypothetical protein
LLLFYSNLSIIAFLSSGSGAPNPLIVRDFNIFSILIVPYSSPGSPPIPTIAATTFYFPFYAFIFSLIVNVCFIMMLLRRK